DGVAAALGLLEAEEARAGADERVPAEAALLDRLEQEARPAELAQPQVGAERAEEVGVEHGCGRGFGQEKRPSRVFVRAVTGCLAPSSGAGSRPARAPSPPRARGESHRPRA